MARSLCKAPVGLNGIVAIAAGLMHVVALRFDGTVMAWGDNKHGECDVPAGLTDVVAIGAGGGYTVALQVK